MQQKNKKTFQKDKNKFKIIVWKYQLQRNFSKEKYEQILIYINHKMCII